MTECTHMTDDVKESVYFSCAVAVPTVWHPANSRRKIIYLQNAHACGLADSARWKANQIRLQLHTRFCSRAWCLPSRRASDERRFRRTFACLLGPFLARCGGDTCATAHSEFEKQLRCHLPVPQAKLPNAGGWRPSTPCWWSLLPTRACLRTTWRTRACLRMTWRLNQLTADPAVCGRVYALRTQMKSVRNSRRTNRWRLRQSPALLLAPTWLQQNV